MAAFQHVSVLISIILGLGFAHLLTGVVRIVQSPERRKPYWLHLVWVFALMISLACSWWLQLSLVELERITFFQYIYATTYAVLQYVACVLLFPLHEDSFVDFRDYYHGPGKWFFAVAAASLVVDVGDTAMRGVDRVMDLGPVYFIGQAGMAALALGAVFIRRVWYHAALAAVWLAYLAAWMATVNRTAPSL